MSQIQAPNTIDTAASDGSGQPAVTPAGTPCPGAASVPTADSAPLHVLCTITAYPPSTGGAQLHPHILFQHMHPAAQVQVVSFWDTNRTDWLLGTTIRAAGTGRFYTIDGIPVCRLGLPASTKMAMLPLVPFYYPLMDVVLPAMARLVERQIEPHVHGVDLIHNMRIGREPLSFASLNLARRQKVPFVLTPVHHPRWVGWRYRAFHRLYREADLVIACTEVEKKTLVELGVSEQKIAVTGIGPVLAPHADPQRFREDYGLNGPMVLFLGQHYRYKGFAELLEAAPLVWQRHPDAQFVFIGPAVGDSESLFAAIDDPRIRRLGRVSLQDKTNALAACDLLCMPSSQEAFGGVYVEAWSFGKPVIGCPIPAVSEVVTHEQDGLLVQPQPPQIADAINQLLDNPKQAAEMGLRGQAKTQQRYNWQTLARKTHEAYRRTLTQFHR